MAESIRDRVIRLIREMRNRTIDRGATPAEAAGFASKVAAWMEKYEIEEAELVASDKQKPIEICQEFISTGKRVFNPGVTAVVSGLCRGSSCKVILCSGDNCKYGIVGSPLDAEYVRQMTATLVPLLKLMATEEGHEHGYEKAGLVRWSNQYLMAAGSEIGNRLIADRDERSKIREIEHLENETIAEPRPGSAALAVVTGNSLAVAKMEAAATKFKQLYPKTTNVRSRSEWNSDARDRGRVAGQNVGLNLSIR